MRRWEILVGPVTLSVEIMIIDCNKWIVRNLWNKWESYKKLEILRITWSTRTWWTTVMAHVGRHVDFWNVTSGGLPWCICLDDVTTSLITTRSKTGITPLKITTDTSASLWNHTTIYTWYAGSGVSIYVSNSTFMSIFWCMHWSEDANTNLTSRAAQWSICDQAMSKYVQQLSNIAR